MKILLASIITFFITFFTLPVIISLFRSINILDVPDRRKIHKISTPSMGGAAILFGMFIGILLFAGLKDIIQYKFFLGGIILIFILGFRDDITSLYANQKLVFQVLSAILVVYFTDIRILGLYGMFGIENFPYWLSFISSVFLIIAVTNSFNLIDGIDGLAGSLSFAAAFFFGLWFMISGNHFMVLMCLTMAGGLAAFLMFNWAPSRIFMGDTGSMPIGFILIVTAIQFINENHALSNEIYYKIENYVPLAIATMIIPVYDTIRVFTLRILAGKSPFVPDRKHIHHIMLKQGFSHSSATITLLIANTAVLFITFQLSQINPIVMIIVQFMIVGAFGIFFDLRLMRYLKNERIQNKEIQALYISKSA